MLLSTVKQFCQRLTKAPIYVAYSGGVDSQVLLHALCHLKAAGEISNQILLVHVNHGLSANADNWQQFAEQQAKSYGIEHYSIKVDVKVKNRQSLEAVAREKRYLALTDIAKQGSYIVTGHHQDDQAETFLLAVKRGAGIKGLSAMNELVPISYTQEKQQMLVRPLLQVSRTEIEQYANTHQLTWIEDESNQDEVFDRNFLRRQVLPLLNERWPSFTSTLSRSVSHCQETQSLLDELAEQDLQACQQNSETNAKTCISNEEPRLNIEILSQLSQARFNHVIRHFIEKYRGLMPSKAQLEQLWLQLSAAGDKNPEVKLGNKIIRRYQNWLCLTDDYQALTDIEIDITDIVAKLHATVEEKAEQSNGEFLQLPDGLGQLCINVVNCHQTLSSAYLKRGDALSNVHFSSDNSNLVMIVPPKDGQKCLIKFNHNNPKCHPEFRDKPRNLKKVLQELAIAPWQRKRLPMLFYDEHLVAVLGQFACNEFVAKQAELFVLLDWQKNKKQG